MMWKNNLMRRRICVASTIVLSTMMLCISPVEAFSSQKALPRVLRQVRKPTKLMVTGSQKKKTNTQWSPLELFDKGRIAEESYAVANESPPLLLSNNEKKKRSLDEITLLPRNIMDRNMTSVEMSAMSAAGLALSLGVIYTLALSNEQSLQEAVQVGENFEGVAERVIAATVPRSASDVLSVALGEGIAGVIGALATVVVSLLFRLREQTAAAQQQVGGFMSENRRQFFTEAVADGDYFLTRAAALPLFEAVGLSPIAATITSVILASVPYELVKLGPQRQRSMMDEDAMMEELLQEERERQRRSRGPLGNLNAAIQSSNVVSLSVDPASLIPVNKGSNIDFPELFADITKWLEYDVLKSDLGGKLMLKGQTLAPNVDSVIFGFLAALSSQLYADLIYRYTEYGTKEKREESLNRSIDEWGKLYLTKSFNAAVLFGIYETVKGPVTSFLLNIGSGGVEGCAGSEVYDLCMETYRLANPSEASNAAQFRSLVTALISLSQQFQSSDSADQAEFLRSLLVQLYSFAQQVFTMSLVS